MPNAAGGFAAVTCESTVSPIESCTAFVTATSTSWLSRTTVAGRTTGNTGRSRYLRPSVHYASDRSRRVWYSARLYTGDFYDRKLDQTELQAFLSPTPRIAFGINADINRFRGGDRITTRLIAPELRLAWNPRIQLTTFYQYNDSVRQGSLNGRFSWEFRPLSYLYVVLNDVHSVGTMTGVRPRRRQLLVKLVYFGHL